MNPYISAPKNLLYFSLLASVNFRLFYIFSCPYSCPSDKKYPSLKELGQFRFFHVKKDVPFCVIGNSREFPITREIALSSQFTHYVNCNLIPHNLIISQLYYLRLSIYSQILSSNRQNGQRLPIH